MVEITEDGVDDIPQLDVFLVRITDEIANIKLPEKARVVTAIEKYIKANSKLRIVRISS
jgi:hypothetical protein